MAAPAAQAPAAAPLEPALFKTDAEEGAALMQYRADYRKFREGHARGAKGERPRVRRAVARRPKFRRVPTEADLLERGAAEAAASAAPSVPAPDAARAARAAPRQQPSRTPSAPAELEPSRRLPRPAAAAAAAGSPRGGGAGGLGARAPTEPAYPDSPAPGGALREEGEEEPPLFFDAAEQLLPCSPASSVGSGLGLLEAPSGAAHHALHAGGAEGEGLEAHYELGADLGSGHFSTVRCATCRATGRAVAVKSAATDSAAGLEAVRALAREAAVLRAVGPHPHVCELLESFEGVRPARRGVWGVGRPVRELHLVLELMAGGELFDALVAAGRFAEWRARREVRTLLRAVAHMHARGVLHRDLKVENLLYADEARTVLKVSDFGLSTQAKAHEALAHTGCGTAGYAAPEVLLRRPYSGKVDVFGAGVVAYVLLSGTEPFTGDNDVQTAEQTCAGAVDFEGEEWADVSEAAVDFVSRCLAVDPAERPTAAEALELPWMRGEGAPTPPEHAEPPHLAARGESL